MNSGRATRLIIALIEAADDCALVPLQDGGDKVDVIHSRRHGQLRVMKLPEAERRLDRAIGAVYSALTGSKLSARELRDFF